MSWPGKICTSFFPDPSFTIIFCSCVFIFLILAERKGQPALPRYSKRPGRAWLSQVQEGAYIYTSSVGPRSWARKNSAPV
jgi:hypothetical protein